jgi:hypothetical protein
MNQLQLASLRAARHTAQCQQSPDPNYLLVRQVPVMNASGCNRGVPFMFSKRWAFEKSENLPYATLPAYYYATAGANINVPENYQRAAYQYDACALVSSYRRSDMCDCVPDRAIPGGQVVRWPDYS